MIPLILIPAAGFPIRVYLQRL